MRGPTTLMNDLRSGDDHSKERCSQERSPLRTIWRRIALKNGMALDHPKERYGDESPRRTITGPADPKEQRPKRTTPNELTLVLRNSIDSVITFPLKGVAPR
jgi:hypothetical protein